MVYQFIIDIFHSHPYYHLHPYYYRLPTYSSVMDTFPKETLAGDGAHQNHHEHPHGKYNERRRTSVASQAAHASHGPLIDHKIPQDEAVQAEPDLLWSRIRHSIREPLAEFFGVFILILFGDGVVAQVVLSHGTKGDYQSISWGWG
jgi:hypothetical protein